MSLLFCALVLARSMCHILTIHSPLQLLHMETVILNALRFNLTAVTPYTFLRRIVSLLASNEQLKHLCSYLAEITIQEFHFLKYRPSVIALSAVILGLHTMDQEPLPDTLRLILKVWDRSIEDLTPCIRDIHMVHCKIFDKSRTMQASYEKYAHQRWSRVSLISPKPVRFPTCQFCKSLHIPMSSLDICTGG